ncbi:KilA-N domain-containing protein [bacterium]|nr:KilA-N domain-containing protein [bacterium]
MDQKLIINNLEIVVFQRNETDYISLTDIARAKNPAEPRFVIIKWMSTKFSIDFLGLWEQMHNVDFNRTEFDTFKNQAGTNSFTMSPDKWIKSTNAIGIVSKSGRYGGGTFAHKDIAFEFASWISAEFKLYLIKEFQRLKEEENKRLELGWDIRRQLTKINYRIHTDSIKKNLLPVTITLKEANIIYASEADVLNKALFSYTAKEWKDKNPKLEGNMRDYASVEQLVCLANLEVLNARFIDEGKTQMERVLLLNKIAINQLELLKGNKSIKKLEK